MGTTDGRTDGDGRKGGGRSGEKEEERTEKGKGKVKGENMSCSPRCHIEYSLAFLLCFAFKGTTVVYSRPRIISGVDGVSESCLECNWVSTLPYHIGFAFVISPCLQLHRHIA